MLAAAGQPCLQHRHLDGAPNPFKAHPCCRCALPRPAAGVDVVHGHSSHHAKGAEVYRGKLILYGAGDLISDYEGISVRQQLGFGVEGIYRDVFEAGACMAACGEVHAISMVGGWGQRVGWQVPCGGTLDSQ